mgnify:CR=1 FL=1
MYWIVELRFDFPSLCKPFANYPPPGRTHLGTLSKAQSTMLPMQRLYAARAGGRHVASVAPRLSRALKSGTWMDRDMKYDT